MLLRGKTTTFCTRWLVQRVLGASVIKLYRLIDVSMSEFFFCRQRKFSSGNRLPIRLMRKKSPPKQKKENIVTSFVRQQTHRATLLVYAGIAASWTRLMNQRSTHNIISQSLASSSSHHQKSISSAVKRKTPMGVSNRYSRLKCFMKLLFFFGRYISFVFFFRHMKSRSISENAKGRKYPHTHTYKSNWHSFDVGQQVALRCD